MILPSQQNKLTESQRAAKEQARLIGLLNSAQEFGVTATEVMLSKSFSYLRWLINVSGEDTINEWKGKTITYKGQTIDQMLAVQIIRNDANPSENHILISRTGGRDAIPILFSEINTEQNTIATKLITKLPPSPSGWENRIKEIIKKLKEASQKAAQQAQAANAVQNILDAAIVNPKDTPIKPAASNEEISRPQIQNTEPSKAMKLLGEFRRLMDRLFHNPKKPTHDTHNVNETPQTIGISQEPEITTTILAEPVSQETPPEELIPEPVEIEEARPLMPEDLPAEILESAPANHMELALQPEDLGEVNIENPPVDDVSPLIQEGTAEIVPPPVIKEIPGSQDHIERSPIHTNHSPMGGALSNAVKFTVAASLALASPNASVKEGPFPQVSQSAQIPQKPQIKPIENQKPEPENNVVQAQKLEFTITEGDTIYHLSKKHNLGNNAWFQYQKHFRLKKSDGSLATPRDVRLPIGAKLVYFPGGVIPEKEISKSIEPNYTIWHFCHDSGLSEQYWQHPENYFRVQFPGKKEFHTPDVYHLPIHGTLHFKMDGFEKLESKENFPPTATPFIEKRITPEIPETIITENIETDSKYIDRLNTPIGVIEPKIGEIFVAKTGSYTAGEIVLYKNEECTVIGRSYNGGLILELNNHRARFALKPESVEGFITRDDTPINALI